MTAKHPVAALIEAVRRAQAADSSEDDEAIARNLIRATDAAEDWLARCQTEGEEVVYGFDVGHACGLAAGREEGRKALEVTRIGLRSYSELNDKQRWVVELRDAERVLDSQLASLGGVTK